MIAYGEDFSGFVATQAGVEPCLADVARLENAWVEAYHAEDEAAATVAGLAGLSSDCLAGTRVAFPAAARSVRFSPPAAWLWAAARHGDGPAAPIGDIAEDALITRPDAD